MATVSTKDEVLSMRDDIIELRDEALKQGDMMWGVRLSHTVKMLGEYAELLPERYEPVPTEIPLENLI